jgi:putative transposase
MEVYKGIKTQIYPNAEQKEYFEKCFNYSRYAFNWYLENNDKCYKSGNKKSHYELRKDFNVMKKQIGNEWLLEVNGKVLEESLNVAKLSLKFFFEKMNKYPHFKSKKDSKQIFSLCRCLIDTDNRCLVKKKHLFNGKHFYIAGRQTGNSGGQRMTGYIIRTKENIWFLKDKKISLVSISKENNKYFVSFKYRENIDFVNNSTNNVGIDIGIKTFATQSDGKVAILPKKINMYYKKIDKLNQILSKKQKGSNNYEKARAKLSKYYGKIKNLKSNFCHRYSTYLTKNYKEIKIEDVSVREWFERKDIKLSKNLQKSCLGLFREQLAYKCEWYNSKLTKIDKYYPSSKRFATFR